MKDKQEIGGQSRVGSRVQRPLTNAFMAHCGEFPSLLHNHLSTVSQAHVGQPASKRLQGKPQTDTTQSSAGCRIKHWHPVQSQIN